MHCPHHPHPCFQGIENLTHRSGRSDIFAPDSAPTLDILAVTDCCVKVLKRTFFGRGNKALGNAFKTFSEPSLVMTCWPVPASSLLVRFQPIWKNFFVSTTASKCEELVLGLGIMYVHFRQIASVSISSRSCGFVVLDELAVVDDVSWLNRHMLPPRQRPRSKSKQASGLLCLEISRCS